MTETEALTAEAAVATLGRLEGLNEALRRRTSGLTWMVWGLASPGIFFTYSFWALLVEFHAPTWWVAFAFLWIPWVAAGTLATVALWRSAGLVVPRVGSRRQGLITFIVFLLVMNLAWPLAHAFDLSLVEPALMLAALGFTSAALGIAGVNCPTREERVLTLGVGVALFAVAVLGSLALPQREAAYAFFSLAAPLVTGAGYFANGLWLTLRG